MSFLTDKAELERQVGQCFDPSFGLSLNNVTAQTFRISDRQGAQAVQINNIAVPLDGGFGMCALAQNYGYNRHPTMFGSQLYRFIRDALLPRYFPIWVHLHWEMPSEFVPPLVEGWVDLGFYHRAGMQCRSWIYTSARGGWNLPKPPVKQEDALVELVELAKRSIEQGVLKPNLVLEAAERGVILGMEELR